MRIFRSSQSCALSGVRSLASAAIVFTVVGCASIPEPKIEHHQFPVERAFLKPPSRPYEKIEIVRTKVNYPTTTSEYEEGYLCKSYYNKAVKQLVSKSRDLGGDAVMEIKSVVFYMDGKSKLYDKPECAEDGDGGQVLVQGMAIRYKSEE